MSREGKKDKNYRRHRGAKGLVDRSAKTFASIVRIIIIIATRFSASLLSPSRTSCRHRAYGVSPDKREESFHSTEKAANGNTKRSAFKTNVHWSQRRTASPKWRPAPRRTIRVGALTRDHCRLLPAGELSPFANSRVSSL